MGFRIKEYYQLTKGGLVFGNVITVIAGFALGSEGGQINLPLLLVTIIGTFLVMTSGCVFNNYIDRDIDALMERTKDRALVNGRISGRAAIVFATVLGILGFFVLIYYTNLLTVLVAAFGFFFYVFMYSSWYKRSTVHGTVVGSFSGAVSPVIGYSAASGRLDIGALILFVIMVVWQMPHFYAIAIRRADDYAAAHIPVLPVARGVRTTKIQMLLYIIGFIIVAPLLTIFGYTGWIYFVIAIGLGLAWFVLCAKGFRISDPAHEKLWARKMFFLSLIVMMVLFITMTFSAVFK